jgi:transcriptional regulator with XRE-family HTH domain
MAVSAAEDIRGERTRRRWTLREVAGRAGLSVAAVHALESGVPASLETYARVFSALGLRAELRGVDPRRQTTIARDEDPVHAAMGELEAGRLAGLGFPVSIDEPYQHYQFAGRADLVAWDLERRALLHLENRTRFPNIQEAFGSYNGKRSYLAPVLAERLSIGPRGWHSVTHAIVALWSAEVLHTLRLRTQSFVAVCPDSAHAFAGWWAGSPPLVGVTSTFIALDPRATGRQRAWVDLPAALVARPRYRGYADAASAQ